MPRLHGLQRNVEADGSSGPLRLRGTVGNLDGDRAVNAGIAHLSLVLIVMMGNIVENKFPILLPIAPPESLPLAHLLALAHGLDLIGEICVEFQAQSEYLVPLGEVGEVDVFVQTKSQRTGETKLHASFRNVCHLPAAPVLPSNIQAVW